MKQPLSSLLKMERADGRGFCEPQKALPLGGFVTRWAGGQSSGFSSFEKTHFLTIQWPSHPPQKKYRHSAVHSLLFQATAAIPSPHQTPSCFFFVFFTVGVTWSARGALRQVKPAVPKPHCSFLLDWTVISRPLESTTRCPARQNTALACT